MYVDSFTLNINSEAYKQRVGLTSDGKIIKTIDAEVVSHLRDYMPRESGLMQSQTYETTPGEIIVNTPYAHYQNVGLLYVMPQNKKGAFYDARTGRYWSKPGVKKEATAIPLKHNGGVQRGSHFVERALGENYYEIIAKAQEELDR